MRTYAIRCSETGRVKIGQTKGDPLRRLESLQTGSPTRLILIAELGVPEANAHFDLRKYRAHGEWFNWAPEVEAYIAKSRIENEYIATSTTVDWVRDEARKCKTCGYGRDRQTCPSCAEMLRTIQGDRGHAHYMYLVYGIGEAA